MTCLRLKCLSLLLVWGFVSSSIVNAQQAQVATEIIQWKIPWPDTRAKAANYPILDGVDHFSVFRAPDQARRYHHHPHIAYAHQKFWVAFSEHAIGEDGPGQHLLVSHSKDGKQWSEPQVCIAPLDTVKQPELRGRTMCSNGWVTVGDRLFAIAEVWDNVGFREVGKDEVHDVRTREAYIRVRKGWGRVVREVHADGQLGELFWLRPDPPAAILPQPEVLPANAVSISRVAKLINEKLNQPVNPTSWDFRHSTYVPLADDGHRMCEPTGFWRTDGSVVRFFRDQAMSHRVYVSISSDQGVTWTVPTSTEIPDSASKSYAGVLPDQRVFLIGNFVAGPKEKINPNHYRRDPLVLALSDDGIVFDRAYAIAHQAPGIRFKGPGKGRGYQYPDAVVVGNDLWIVYSVNKEDIAVARIPLDRLSPTEMKK